MPLKTGQNARRPPPPRPPAEAPGPAAPADLRERRRLEETADALRVLAGRPTTADAVAHVLRDAGTGRLGGPRSGTATEM
ncbi:predicted protein [Streptomyces sp. SPB78]|nr:predicted protein [Streptomyces sp. SPB78]